MLATGFPYDRAALPRALRSFEAFSVHSQAVRRIGSAALDLCYVACGRFDAYWEHHVSPWDMAAGTLLVEEAGGRVSGMRGESLNLHGPHLLATNSHIHDETLTNFDEIFAGNYRYDMPGLPASEWETRHA